MHRAGLRAKQKRRFRPRTTDRRHLRPIAPNHLAERVGPPTRPGEVWQADITDVATKEDWLYVAGVLDACSCKIVGWAAGDRMPTALVARAFGRAVQAERPAPGLLHHSDRGSQYASDAYRELLRRHGALGFFSPVDFESEFFARRFSTQIQLNEQMALASPEAPADSAP